jgi:hypothetical protein
MQRDEVRALARRSGELAPTVRHVAVRGAVKAVAAHLVAAIELVGDGVEVRVRRQRAVEGGVEHRDLRHARAQDRRRGADALEVGRVVQRREIDRVLDPLQYLVVDPHRAREALAPVHDPVTDRVDLGASAERHAALAADEPRDDVLDGRPVVAQGGRGLLRRSAAAAQREHGLAAQALDGAAGELVVGVARQPLLVGADELELDGRRADVQDEDVHEGRERGRALGRPAAPDASRAPWNALRRCSRLRWNARRRSGPRPMAGAPRRLAGTNGRCQDAVGVLALHRRARHGGGSPYLWIDYVRGRGAGGAFAGR